MDIHHPGAYQASLILSTTDHILFTHSLTNILATNHTCRGAFSNPERAHQDEQSGALAFTKGEYCNRSIFPYCSFAKGIVLPSERLLRTEIGRAP